MGGPNQGRLGIGVAIVRHGSSPSQASGEQYLAPGRIGRPFGASRTTVPKPRLSPDSDQVTGRGWAAPTQLAVPRLAAVAAAPRRTASPSSEGHARPGVRRSLPATLPYCRSVADRPALV